MTQATRRRPYPHAPDSPERRRFGVATAPRFEPDQPNPGRFGDTNGVGRQVGPRSVGCVGRALIPPRSAESGALRVIRNVRAADGHSAVSCIGGVVDRSRTGGFTTLQAIRTIGGPMVPAGGAAVGVWCVGSAPIPGRSGESGALRVIRNGVGRRVGPPADFVRRWSGGWRSDGRIGGASGDPKRNRDRCAAGLPGSRR